MCIYFALFSILYILIHYPMTQILLPHFIVFGICQTKTDSIWKVYSTSFLRFSFDLYFLVLVFTFLCNIIVPVIMLYHPVLVYNAAERNHINCTFPDYRHCIVFPECLLYNPIIIQFSRKTSRFFLVASSRCCFPQIFRIVGHLPCSIATTLPGF